jgi:hypothetical protein
LSLASRIGTLAVALVCGPALAWAQTPQRPIRDPGPPRTRILKAWDDTIKQDGTEIERHVTIVFDYPAGTAMEYAYDAKGRLLSSRRLTANLPRPTPEEFDEAVTIVRADPQLGRIMARTRARPEGGFLLEEGIGQPCGPRTRCIQILWMAEDSMGLLRRVVVDLAKRSIAHASYVPKDGKAGKQ